MFQTNTLASINPRDLDGNCGLRTQLADLLRVIGEGVTALNATRDSKGFEELVKRFIADLGMSLDMFGIAQIRVNASKLDNNASKLDNVYAKLTADTQEEKPPAGARVLFVGNPGTGKSTLLNALLGTVLFRSGVSDVKLGAGITNYVKWVHHRGVMYGDTPGLNDQTNKVQAAQQIAEGLKAGGVYRLEFVITLGERYRPLAPDMATMKITLDAINKPNLEYGIIVNKVRAKMAKKLKGACMDQLGSQLNSHGSRSTTKRVLLYLKDEFLEDEDNVLSDAPHFFLFIRGLPWQSFGNVDGLKMARYEEQIKMMEDRIAQLQMTEAEASSTVVNPPVAPFQQGSSVSLATSAPTDDQWHVGLLDWLHGLGLSNGSMDGNGRRRFEPKFPVTKGDLLALTALRLWDCNISESEKKRFKKKMQGTFLKKGPLSKCDLRL